MAKRTYDNTNNASPLICYYDFPLDIILQIAENIYDFKDFKALGLACKFLVSRLLAFHPNDAVPMDRFLDRTRKRFTETLQFYYQVQYELALMYIDVGNIYRYITQVRLPYDVSHRSNDIHAFSKIEDGKYPLNNTKRQMSIRSLFHLTQGFTNNGSMTKYRELFLIRLDKLLRQCYYATLVVEGNGVIHPTPYSYVTPNMLIYLKSYHPELATMNCDNCC